MGYSADIPEQYRGAADYVNCILKGAKPGELPVQQGEAAVQWWPPQSPNPRNGNPTTFCEAAILEGQRLKWVCAVTRRRFPVGASPTRQPLQPEAVA
jgi:hypothetical protein